MDVVLVMFKDNERRDFPMTQARIVLGRRTDCQLRIPTRDVSRQHCELVQEKGALEVRDLGSSNGTFVNGKRIAQAALKPGDNLRVGPVTFVVQINGNPAKVAPAPDQLRTNVTPAAGGSAAGDDDTFELNEADLELDDLSFDDDEKDMP